MEMIELRALRPERALDLTEPRPAVRLERANALRISPKGKVPEILSRVRRIRLRGGQRDPRLTEELGEGHRFRPCAQSQPTWCDLCGEFIWGASKKTLQCLHCKFICHYRCRALIRLDCSGPRYQDNDQNEGSEQTVEKDTNVEVFFLVQEENLIYQKVHLAQLAKSTPAKIFRNSVP